MWTQSIFCPSAIKVNTYVLCVNIILVLKKKILIVKELSLQRGKDTIKDSSWKSKLKKCLSQTESLVCVCPSLDTKFCYFNILFEKVIAAKNSSILVNYLIYTTDSWHWWEL